MPAALFPLAFVLWAFLHSLLASLTVKAAGERLLGRYFRFYRPLYVVFSAATLAIVWFLVPRPQGIIYQVSGVAYYVFQALRIVGVLGFVAASTQFDASGFLGLRASDSKQDGPLNTGGMFAYVRHPLYLSGLLILWFEPRMSVWWLEVCVLATAYLFVGAVFEERKLVAAYGEEYTRYRKSVPMWLPDVRKLWRR